METEQGGMGEETVKALSELIKATAKRFGHNVSIIYDKESLTYSDLSRKINIFAGYLLNNGINYQDKVAVFLSNSPLFIIAFFAIAKIGAIAITLNTNYKEEELKSYLKGMSVKYFISDVRLKDRCEKAICGEAINLIIIDSKKVSSRLNKNYHINIRINSEDEVLQQFSSGSTGKPKRVGRNHFNLLSEAKSISKTIGISGKDKILCAVPLFHAYGFGSAMLPSIYSGAQLILLDKFSPRRILNILKKEKITIFFGVPYMFSMLADVLMKQKPKMLSLRYCFSAGISLPEEVSKKFYRKFGVFVRDLYGTSETGCISLNLNKRIETTLNSVGLPIIGTKVKVTLEGANKAEVGQAGQIAVKTPTCGRWYYIGNTKKTLLKDGYFYTGDIGKKDKRENLYILGRKTTFINVAGIKVDPREVEDTLKKYLGIKEVVVVGSPDKLRGEIVKAIIVSNGRPIDTKNLLNYCREKMANFKIPRIVQFRDRLPKSPLGKILKGYL